MQLETKFQRLSQTSRIRRPARWLAGVLARGWDKSQFFYWVMVVRLNSALLDAGQPAGAFFCNGTSESE